MRAPSEEVCKASPRSLKGPGEDLLMLGRRRRRPPGIQISGRTRKLDPGRLCTVSTPTRSLQNSRMSLTWGSMEGNDVKLPPANRKGSGPSLDKGQWPES